MSLDDEQQTELHWRRVAEKAQESVETTLRKRYSWIGLITAFVLGGVGFGIVSEVVSDASKSVMKTELLLDAAKTRLDNIETQTQSKLAQIDDLAKQSQGKLDLLVKNVEATQANVENRTQVIDELLSAREQDLKNLGDTADEIKELWQQMQDLNDRVGELAKGELPDSATSSIDIAKRSQQYSNVVRARIEASRTTIYVQVSSDRSLGRAVAEILSQAGYTVPGVELVKSAPPKQEVRYFYPEDRSTAKEVADTVKEALSKVGAPDTSVTPTDLTAWPTSKPREGTLELWLRG